VKALAALALATAALTAASPAAAKGPVDVTICGATECVEIHAGEDGRTQGSALAYGLLDVGSSPDFVAAPPAQPWYSVELDADWFGRNATMPYADGLLGVGNSWVRPRLPVAMSLKRFTRELEPRPPVEIRAATVDGEPVADPGAYDALLGELPIGVPPDRLGRAVVIRLTPDVVTQWADPERSLAYFPPQRLLRRGPDWVRVPDAVAATIESDAGLVSKQPAAPSAASGFPAGDVAAALAVLAAAVGLVLVSRRRRQSRAT
jgi:hypothetical protein